MKHKSFFLTFLFSCFLLLPIITFAATPTIHYPLNDGTGTTANDTQGSNNGTFFNTPTWNNTTQKLGSHALDFDGGNTANDYVEVAHSADLSQSEFSASTWFRLDQLPSTAGSNATIARKRRSVAPFYIWDLSVISATDKLLFRVHDGTSTYTAESDSAIVAGTWYHTVARLDASGNATLHIDAAQQAIADTGASVTTANPDALRIGAGGATANGLDGTIDDMCYFNSTLSAGEITALYNGGAGVECGVDTTAPTLTQTTPVTTPTNDTTPEYTFTTDEAGTITYGGSCSAATTTATVGANTLSFNTLANGTYSDCTITVTDAASNASTALAVTAFTIDTTDPVITITAPTKTSITSITDTTVQVTDNTGITTTSVTVDGATTATTSSFACVQTNTTTVDCTLSIDESGNLTIAASDDAGNATTKAETGYTVTGGTSPTIHYPLNDGTGTTANDTQGSNNGTLFNTPTWNNTTQKLGSHALDFDGGNTANDYVEVAHSADLSQSEFSASTWFRLDQLPSTAGSNATIARKRRSVAPFYIWDLSVISATDKLLFRVHDGTSTYTAESDSAIVAGTWYHTVARLDASGNATLHIDAAQQAIADTGASVTTANPDALRIGAGGATANGLDGTIDDMCYFNSTLSAGEITALYNGGAGVECGVDTTAPTLTQTTPVTTPTNDTTPEYTFTTDEAGTITYGGSCSAATTTATVGANTLSFNTLANGTYSDCTITVTDAASNASTALAVTAFTIDTTDPVITITAPTKTSITSITDTTVQVTDNTGITTTSVTVDGATTATTSSFACVQTNTTTVDCTLSIDESGNLTIAASDDAGNATTKAETGYTVTGDITAPTLTQTTPVTTPTNDTTPEYTFTTDEAGTITYGGSCSAATTTATVGANTLSFNTLANGTYSDCTITVTDAASNASTALAVTAFTIDTTDPVITITAPTKTSITSITDTTVQVTDNTGITTTSVTVDGATTATTSSFACVQTNTTTVDCTLSIDESGNLTIAASDDAGNATTKAETGYTVTGDITAPALTQTTPVTTPTNDTTPEYTFTTDEAGTITYGGSCSAATTTATVGANTLSFNTLANGTYSDCTITVTDAASNASTALAVTAFTIDTTDPVITITAPTKTSITSITDTTVQVTDNTGITTTSVTVDGATTATTSSFACVQTNTTTVDCTLSIDESGNLTIAASDDAGNATTKAETGYTVTGDITAPALTQTTPVTTPTNDTTPEYTFTTDEAGTITYGGSCSAATTTATVGANTLSFNTLANGTYSDCTITVTDAASNASTALAVTAFTIDTTDPVITITAPTKTSITSITDTTVQVTDNTGITTTSVTVDGATTATTSSFACVQTNTTTVDCTLSIDESGNLTIAASDDAGNATTKAETGYTVTGDITAPDVTLEQEASQLDPTRLDSATFTVTFSEPINVSTFIASDIALTGTTTGIVTAGPTESTPPNDGTTFTFTVTGMSENDTITATLPAGVVEDLAANINTASTSTDNNVSYILIRVNVDDNSVINVIDALLIQRFALGSDMTSTPWISTPTTGDTDCNGSVTVIDALLAQRFVLGLDMSATAWCAAD